jgi:release factor glutamine methyltransferase
VTVGQLLASAAARLKQAGVESAPFEAQLMLAHVLKQDRVWLAVNRDRAVPARDCERFARFVKERSSRKPLQYVLGETGFYGHTIFVNKHVLIPRPETEILVEQVVKRWKAGYRSILDIGTGSGAIAIALAKGLPQARVTATDISARALAVAGKNIAHHHLSGRVKLVKADLFPVTRTKYDVIVSNPPYIPSQDIRSLQPEVAEHEPRPALDGGSDGLDFYRRIIAGCPLRMNPGGMMALEIGQGQGEAVRKMISSELSVTVLPDLGAIPRVVVAVDRSG